MSFLPEIKVWYRSACVWFLGFAAFMQVVELALPSIQQSISPELYGWAKCACILVAGVAKFIPQPKMRQALEEKENAT